METAALPAKSTLGLSQTSIALAVGGVAAFEAIAWVGPSPVFSHDGPIVPRIIMGAINSVPHALFAWHLSASKAPSPTALSLYTPYSLAFFTGQLRFWWAPYLAGVTNKADSAFLKDKKGYQAALKVLPRLPLSARIPSLEHTLLVAPSAVVAACSCAMLKSAVNGSFSNLSVADRACLLGMTALGLTPAVVPMLKHDDHAPASAVAASVFVAGLGFSLATALQAALRG